MSRSKARAALGALGRMSQTLSAPAAAARAPAPAGRSTGVRAIADSALRGSDSFEQRHQGRPEADLREMLDTVGYGTVDDLMRATVPKKIHIEKNFDMGQFNEPVSETQFLEQFKQMASKNQINKSFIGMGYHDTITPAVIKRNIIENPGWTSGYTPYQPEIAQGRMESLLNYQTVVCDLTGMELTNASLLDEATAAAEAMTMCSGIARSKKPRFLLSSNCHPQTISVVKTRADGLGLRAEVMAPEEMDVDKSTCGVLLQYPDTTGQLSDPSDAIKRAHDAGANVVLASDPLALTRLESPAELGADIAVGSMQRFGVPMGYGGPHAAFLATSAKNKRLMPGRIIGVSVDGLGQPTLRMAMQTREQHIRRDKATSNICTSQALLANVAAMYACYHGPDGLRSIADRVSGLAGTFAEGAKELGHGVPEHGTFFDTVTVNVGQGNAPMYYQEALNRGLNIRTLGDDRVSAAFDETHTPEDVDALLEVLSTKSGKSSPKTESLASKVPEEGASIPAHKQRASSYLTNEVFNSFHTEHELLRYMKRLENRDLSLVHSMIPLGSCTMKLNATAEMEPITWPELAKLHPFAPRDQAQGYMEMMDKLKDMLCRITGFDDMTMQPNAGAAGEYSGLMSIRAYHRANGDLNRDTVLIPTSAHGTNPASARMCGYQVVTIGTDDDGNVDVQQVRDEAAKYGKRLAGAMVTYPSTHGVYEEGITDICEAVHKHGGQVYMDGANLNAQLGITTPGDCGADVCHLNLHKTFCIPHGGGGPGMGPIGVKKHLSPHLPDHPVMPTANDSEKSFGTVSAAPYGSTSILPISYAFIAMMGRDGMQNAAKQAILAANYTAERLGDHYPIVYKGPQGTVAHEFIVDLRPYKESAGIEAGDVAKRLIDYGYHAPTMSWPVVGALMVEPTESESKAELDRFCNAMINIRKEIKEVEDGVADAKNNVLKNAPHSPNMIVAEEWDKPYSRKRAAYPASWTKQAKFWPATARVDDVYGDRNLQTNRDAFTDEAVAAEA